MCKENCLLGDVESLRDHAWQQAIKYRFDPALGRAHEMYLEVLNDIISQELQKQKAV